MIQLSYSSYKEISQLKYMHKALIYGFHMTWQGHSHGWAWKGIGPPTGEPGTPTGEPGPANQNSFFLTKELNYRQKYSCLGGWS